MAVNLSKKRVLGAKVSVEDLPRIGSLEGASYDPEAIRNADPEGAGRALLHARRERARMRVIDEIESVAKARLVEYFESLPEGDRQPLLIGTAGRVSYRAEQYSTEVADVEELLKDLTPEQIAATYKPDVKALEQVLDKATRDKHLVRKRVRSSAVVPTDKGGEIE